MGTHELPPPTHAHTRTCSFVRDLLAASSVLQAYLLGAATSELALMQQASRERRVRLEAVKQHLRYLRVPPFLKDQILEYYDMVVIRKQMQEVDVLSSMPSSLKVLPRTQPVGSSRSPPTSYLLLCFKLPHATRTPLILLADGASHLPPP